MQRPDISYYCRYRNEILPFQPLRVSTWRKWWFNCCGGNQVTDLNHHFYVVDDRPMAVILGQEQIPGWIVVYDEDNRFHCLTVTLHADHVFCKQ